MASCINKSHPKFKELLAETNLKEDILAAKITNWRENTGKESDDDFPTKGQILTYALKFNINEKLVEEAIEELEGFEKEGVSKTVSDLFTVLSSNWNRLQNASLTDIRKLFNNPTIGNEFKFLLERIKSVQEKTDEGVNFQEKVRALALTVRELSATVEKMKDRIKDSDFQSLPPLESLQLLNKYMSFLKDWEQITDQMIDDFAESPKMLQILSTLSGQIKAAKRQIVTPKKDSLVTFLTEALDPAIQRINDKYFEDMKKLEQQKAEAEKKGDKLKVKIIEKRIEDKTAQYEKEAINQSVILETLEGKKGDAGFFNSILESFSNSSDPITAATKEKIKEAINRVLRKVNTMDMQMQRELKPLLEKMGASRFKIFEFNKQFVQFVKRVSKEGKEFFTVSLMNEFTGQHEQDMLDFQRKIDEALEKNDQKEVIKLRTEFSKWNNQYMYQEYTPEVYERYEVWERDEAGRKAKELRDEIFAKMNSLIAKTKKGTSIGYSLTPEEEAEYQGYLDDLKKLSSLTDEYGRTKDEDSMDYKIAKAIQEYNKKTKDIYVWKERKGAFEAARKKQIEYLKSLKQADPTIDEEDLLARWELNNTRTVISPEFYIKRKEILEKINKLSAKLKEKSDKEVTKEFTEAWDEIFAQLVGYRDKDGQPIASDMTQEKIEKIKQISEQLENLKKKIENVSGLSSSEWDTLNKLNKLDEYNFLSQEQKKQRRELLDKQKSLGLSKDEKEEFYDAIEQLQELQSKVPTDYYVSALNGFSSELGMDFNTETASELLESPQLENFLKNPKFKEWFEKNHIRVNRYNSELGRSIEVWERLYVWNRIIPNDPKYYETTTLEDGTEIKGKPALKYYYRDVKDEITELKDLRELETLDRFQEERLKVLEQKEKNNTLVSYKTEKIVGKTVNNKGEFLPKDIDALDKTKDDWDKYINYDYVKLKENAAKDPSKRDEIEYAKYQAIEIFKKYYLEYQDKLPYNERMWYTLPAVRKTFSERVRSGEYGPKSLWAATMERLKLQDEVSQDEEETNVQQTEEKQRIARADLFGNVLTDIPMKFTGLMSSDMISLNIGKSIAQYGLAAESKKELVKLDPFISSLISFLESAKLRDLSTFRVKWNAVVDALGGKKYKKTLEPVLFRGESRRLKNIRSMQDQYFRGIYKTGLFGERTAIDDVLESYIINPILRLAGFGTLAADYSGAFVNSVVGNYFAIIEANPLAPLLKEGEETPATTRNFNFKDYVKAFAEFHSKVLADMMKDAKGELGEKSFYGQLFNLFDPEQKLFTQIGQKYDKPGWLSSSLYIKDMFLNPREFGEFQISATVLLAVLRNTKIKTDNGETISLIDAYEIGKNGDIKLKDGVTFSEKQVAEVQGKVTTILRNTQGNYANIDKTELERNTLGSIVMFMRKYFVPLLMTQWHTRRFNIYTGYGSGYSIETINVIKYGVQGIIEYVTNMEQKSAIDYIFAIPKGFSTGISTASRDQQLKAISALSIVASSLLLSILLGYWDDDDERRKRTKTVNWSYDKIVALTALIKIKSEIEQFTPFGGRNEIIKLFTNPFMIASKASQINTLIDYLAYQLAGNEEKSTYQEKGGQKKKYMELYGTDSKALVAFYKLLGYRGGSVIPFADMEQEKKAAAARLESTSKIVEGK